MPMVAAYGMQAMVSLGRLQRFLEEDEYSGRLQKGSEQRNAIAGQVNGGTIGWISSNLYEDESADSDQQRLTLGNNQTGSGTMADDQTDQHGQRTRVAPEFTPVLQNVHDTFEKGSLIIVLWPVGAGKSKISFFSVHVLHFVIDLNCIVTFSG